MMCRHNIVFGILIVVISFGTLAQGPGWVASSEVHRVVITTNGGVNVRLKPELTGCISQSGYGANFASVYPDHPGIEKIHSLLIAAQLNGSKVAIYLTDENCRVGEVVLGGNHSD